MGLGVLLLTALRDAGHVCRRRQRLCDAAFAPAGRPSPCTMNICSGVGLAHGKRLWSSPYESIHTMQQLLQGIPQFLLVFHA